MELDLHRVDFSGDYEVGAVFIYSGMLSASHFVQNLSKGVMCAKTRASPYLSALIFPR